MKDDLPRFPTPMEAFGQGKRKHTSAAFEAVGEVPKPPPQQRFRQKASGSPAPGTPVNGAPGHYYAQPPPQAAPVHSAPATPNHAYHGMHAGIANAQPLPQPALRGAPAYAGPAMQPTPPMAPQQFAQQFAQQAAAPPMGGPGSQQYAPGAAYHMASAPPPPPLPAAAYAPRVATAPPAQAGPYAPPNGARLPSNPMLHAQYPGRPSPPPSREEARRPAEPRERPSDTADLRSLFDEVDRKKHGYLTERELSKALVNGDYTLFDAHTVRLMMKMFDRDGDGAIYFAEFGQLWKYLHEWRQVFDRFDTSRNDSIDPDEFNRALTAFGYSLSAPCVQFMFNAGSKLNRQGVREMPFDLFVQTCISIKSITDTFKRYDTDRDGYVTMSFEDFLTETTKLH